MSISRDQARLMAEDTVRAVDAGHYTNLHGETVDFAPSVRHAVAGTVSYPPEAKLPAVVSRGLATAYVVVNESTLVAAERLAREGLRPVALNFASAKHPGGGFLNGAIAQEECLCRASALYASIRDNPMYAFHARQSDPMYSHYAIYSPEVPVIKTDDGVPLTQPYLCSFVTSPAANAGVLMERTPDRAAELEAVMAQRIEVVLTIMAGHDHEAAILGAWGCGVFRNDPTMIAGLFHDALNGPFRGVFARVVFAVLDWSDDRHFIGPFEKRFGV